MACDDAKPLDTDLTKEIIVEWLERFAEQKGIKILATSTIDILATIIIDVHGRVKDNSEVTKRKRCQTIA